MLAGPLGLGKTMVALGLGLLAVDEGYTVAFEKMGSLVKIMDDADVDRKAGFRLRYLRKCQLVIIDEIGYTPITKAQANRFFSFVSDAYERSSLVFATNKEIPDWAEMVGDPVLATALMDRILHDASRCRASPTGSSTPSSTLTAFERGGWPGAQAERPSRLAAPAVAGASDGRKRASLRDAFRMPRYARENPTLRKKVLTEQPKEMLTVPLEKMLTSKRKFCLTFTREPYNELLATRLLSRILPSNAFVPYELEYAGGRAQSACPTMSTPDTEFISAYEVTVYVGISEGRDLYEGYASMRGAGDSGYPNRARQDDSMRPRHGELRQAPCQCKRQNSRVFSHWSVGATIVADREKGCDDGLEGHKGDAARAG